MSEQGFNTLDLTICSLNCIVLNFIDFSSQVISRQDNLPNKQEFR